MSDGALVRIEDDASGITPRESGGVLDSPVSHEVHAHPSPFQYVMIAMILCVITGVEIVVSYSAIPDGLMVVLLLGMAIIKFALVASWFMHLRTDKPIFRNFFILGLVAAVVLYLIVLSMLHVFS